MQILLSPILIHPPHAITIYIYIRTFGTHLLSHRRYITIQVFIY